MIFVLILALLSQDAVVRSPGMTMGTIPKASAAQGLNNSNLLQNGDGTLTPSKALALPIPSLPTFNAAGTTTCDFSLSNSCYPGSMTGNTTLAVVNPHGVGPYRIIWTQDATGNRTVAYPGSFNNTVCFPSPTANVTTFIDIVFNALGNATYDGINCVSTDAPTIIAGAERAPITTTASGQGILSYDSGTHSIAYYANNSANKHIMPRTASVTDVLSCADLTACATIVAAPAMASDACTTNQIAFATGFIYVCVATNTWQRVAIATF